MLLTRSVVVGIVLAALAAGPAQAAAPELSVSERLQDRREVAAGTRAQVLGFEDGRFYANGWHITGEMGGIVTPPLKLLDSPVPRCERPVGGTGHAPSPAGRATCATPCRRSTASRLRADRRRPRRPSRCPDRLKLTNPNKNRRRVNVMVDAHSELMTQFPWGFNETIPNASDNAADSGSLRRTAASCSATRGAYPGETGDHSFLAMSGFRPRSRGRRPPGPAITVPFGPGPHAVPPTRRPRRCRASATMARSDAARAAGCTTRSTSRAAAPPRCGSPSPARRTRSPRRAASSAALTATRRARSRRRGFA